MNNHQGTGVVRWFDKSDPFHRRVPAEQADSENDWNRDQPDVVVQQRSLRESDGK